jgi:hypothetical protein
MELKIKLILRNDQKKNQGHFSLTFQTHDPNDEIEINS